jgi:DnaJ family protein C protein 8
LKSDTISLPHSSDQATSLAQKKKKKKKREMTSQNLNHTHDDAAAKATTTTTIVADPIERMIKKILYLKNPYDQLGVRPETASDAVRKQYRRLTLQVHPDRCSHPQAGEAAAALSRAIAIVESAEQRRPYAEVMARARQKTIDAWERAKRPWKRPRQRPPDDDGVVVAGDDEEEDETFLFEWRRETHAMIAEAEEREKRMKEAKAATDKRAREEEEREK